MRGAIDRESRAQTHASAASDPGERLRELTGRSPAELAEQTESITLTVTTCKRPELFERTIGSFLRCCTDADRIRRWVCVDDDSSEEARVRMRDRYPLEYVWKPPHERGHARSMNLLRDAIAERPTEFVLHLEDDWEFFRPAALVADAISVLRRDERIGQVLFNRNYAEDGDPSVGGVPVTGHGHPPYVLHEHHRPGSPEYAAFLGRVGGRANHAYWPHYSLRPSVLRSRVWHELGPFDEAHGTHFELDYATRYRDAGWRSAFFPGTCCRHIGRLTSERGGSPRANAYQLNAQPQFGVARAARSASGRRAIPRTIHQIWLGPAPPPLDLIETWRDAHPDWEHRLWTDAELPRPLVNQAQLEAMGELCGKADVLRYELLLRHGGVYVDADMECLRPLPESLLADPCFTAYESEEHRPGVIANGVIGAEPGHPLMAAMIMAIRRLEPASLRGRVAAWTTGSYAFTRAVHAQAAAVRVHPSGLFYPDHYLGPGRGDARAVGRHDWFFGTPTVCLAAVVEGGAGEDLAAELRSMRPQINRWVVAVVDEDPRTAATVEAVLGQVPGALLARPGAPAAAAWTEAVGTAATMADVVALGCTAGFSRLALRPDADGYSIGGALRAVRAGAGWSVTGAANGLPELSGPEPRVEELTIA